MKYHKPIEIGLYYLQSRYYDADVGRFVNGDMPEFAVSGQTVLGHNLFGYCKNSPIINADYWGMDAVILQSMESVFNFGHMGLMFQYNKNWYYWYWGLRGTIAGLQYAITALLHLKFVILSLYIRRPQLFMQMLSLTIVRTLSKTVLATAKLKKICPNKDITSKSKLSEINTKLSNKGVGYGHIFEKGLYLKGNFSKAYLYLKLQKVLLRYNLLKNNCMQTSISALCWGTFSSNNVKNHLQLILAQKMIIPNLAFNHLKKYFTSLSY